MVSRYTTPVNPSSAWGCAFKRALSVDVEVLYDNAATLAVGADGEGHSRRANCILTLRNVGEDVAVMVRQRERLPLWPLDDGQAAASSDDFDIAEEGVVAIHAEVGVVREGSGSGGRWGGVIEAGLTPIAAGLLNTRLYSASQSCEVVPYNARSTKVADSPSATPMGCAFVRTTMPSSSFGTSATFVPAPNANAPEWPSRNRPSASYPTFQPSP